MNLLIDRNVPASDDFRRSPTDGSYNIRPFKISEPDVFECRAVIFPEEDGGFTAFAIRLPGVASQGDTEAEAIENLREAFRGVIKTYRSEEMEVPWQDNVGFERPASAKERWIVVNV